MHGILHATLIIAISLYVQVDTRGYVFHPQPWVLTRRSLQEEHSTSDKVSEASSAPDQQSRSQELREDNGGYLVYSTGASQEDNNNSNVDSSEGARFRSQENPSNSEDSSEYPEHRDIEQRQRNRYRDEPIDGMYEEDDEDLAYEFREQPAQGYSDHSPYPYADDGNNNDDRYDQEDSYDDAENTYGNDLQLETNAEPYDDEVAAKDENGNNNNQDETYSLEYTQSDLDSGSSNTNKNSDSNNSNNNGPEKASSESNDDKSQAKGDDGSDSEEDDYEDDDDNDYDDDYQDDQVYDSGGGGGKGKGRRRGNQQKKVTAPFWGPHDYTLGDHKGQGWAVQGPPVYFRDGEPEWPPEPHGGGRGRKGGKGGKGGKGKGKGKGKKGKKGGMEKKGWGHQGWGGWEKIGNGGWGNWPKGWISGTNLDTGGQRWVEGKGWVGGTGAPWIPKKDVPHHWGFPLGWGKMEDQARGGKKGKGKGGKGGKKRGKGGKGKKRKKKCKKKKGKGGKGRKGGKGGKGGKKGGGCGESGWGWPKPHFLKLKPIPPRGSQVWLKPGGGWPSKPIGGWHPQRGWDILRKVTGGWMLPDLVGVVNLNG